jgi:syntaxin-binding protein 5
VDIRDPARHTRRHGSPEYVQSTLLPLSSTPSNSLTVGGPDRPPSKRQLAQARSEAEQARRAARSTQPSSSSANPSYPTSPTQQANEGWGTWATRAFNERTEKLNAVTDNMNNLSANSAGWADDVSKFVGKQKRGFVMGAVKSKFGF